MGSNNPDKELKTLWLIGELKNELPLHLRGWLPSLGLYVQLRRGEGWSKLQAGGKYRSYLDAWCREEDEWEVTKFNKGLWGRRFAAIVQPTYEIADFVINCETAYGDFEEQNALLLTKVIEHLESTGKWLGLPAYYKHGDQKFGAHLDCVRSKEVPANV